MRRFISDDKRSHLGRYVSPHYIRSHSFGQTWLLQANSEFPCKKWLLIDYEKVKDEPCCAVRVNRGQGACDYKGPFHLVRNKIVHSSWSVCHTNAGGILSFLFWHGNHGVQAQARLRSSWGGSPTLFVSRKHQPIPSKMEGGPSVDTDLKWLPQSANIEMKIKLRFSDTPLLFSPCWILPVHWEIIRFTL